MDINKLSALINDYFKNNDVITDVEIITLVKQCYPNFNFSYKSILIEKLISKRIIYCYNLNVYKVYRKRKEFVPYQNKSIEKQLIKYIREKDIKISYFNSSFYNSLTLLQSMKNYIFIGVESYAVDYLVNKIEKDHKKIIATTKLASLRQILSNVELNFDYVIKTINVDTPLFKKNSNSFYYPKLETLLVDLIADKTLSDLYSSQIIEIYENTLKDYAIKINTLLRYASKKGTKEKITSLLKDIGFDIGKGEFIND